MSEQQQENNTQEVELLRLTDDLRHQAREQARESVAREFGDEPIPEDFDKRSVGEYPGWLVWLVGLLMILVLGAAANISLLRIYTAGYDYALESLRNDEGNAEVWGTEPSEDIINQAKSVGVSMFILAEFTVVICVVAKKLYFATPAENVRWWRRSTAWLNLAITLSLAIALVGNWVATSPDDADVWAILETLAPPVIVLVIALILEGMVLHSVKERHGRTLLYERALAKWQADTSITSLETHPLWKARWANALREAIEQYNARGRGRDERVKLMQSLTRQDWSRLVWREMLADEWFDEDALVDPTNPAAAGEVVTAPRISSNGQHG